jgi:hypothetical protein
VAALARERQQRRREKAVHGFWKRAFEGSGAAVLEQRAPQKR